MNLSDKQKQQLQKQKDNRLLDSIRRVHLQAENAAREDENSWVWRLYVEDWFKDADPNMSAILLKRTVDTFINSKK